MQIIDNLENTIAVSKQVVLTIGNFDGMHRGHQAVLHEAKELASQQDSLCAALTFTNHPSEILHYTRTPLIYTLAHKIMLLDEAGIDLLILLPFTQEFSQQSAESFLKNVYNVLPFRHLMLGHDAAIGKNREGDRSKIKELSIQMGFNVTALKPYTWKDQIISSSKIRSLIQQGNLIDAEDLLGRCYSIYGVVIRGASIGKQLGYPTINIDVSGLCLPPFGVYVVQLIHKGELYNAVANLGLAPTIRNDKTPLLEVHLLNVQKELYEQYVEVRFLQYLRPEKQFSSLEELQQQIYLDTQQASHTIGKIVPEPEPVPESYYP